jgi:hypothetical protein
VVVALVPHAERVRAGQHVRLGQPEVRSRQFGDREIDTATDAFASSGNMGTYAGSPDPMRCIDGPAWCFSRSGAVYRTVRRCDRRKHDRRTNAGGTTLAE